MRIALLQKNPRSGLHQETDAYPLVGETIPLFFREWAKAHKEDVPALVRQGVFFEVQRDHEWPPEGTGLVFTPAVRGGDYVVEANVDGFRPLLLLKKEEVIK